MGGPGHPSQRQPGRPTMMDKPPPSPLSPHKPTRADSDAAPGILRIGVQNKANPERTGIRQKGSGCSADRLWADFAEQSQFAAGEGQRNKGAEAQSRGGQDSHLRKTKPISSGWGAGGRHQGPEWAKYGRAKQSQFRTAGAELVVCKCSVGRELQNPARRWHRRRTLGKDLCIVATCS
jgi:hypothetical protein